MQSKKKLLTGLLLVVFLLCFLAGCSSPAAKPDGGKVGDGQTAEEQKPIELKMADLFPASHKAVSVNVQRWIEAVEEATGGKVKIEHYPGETLLKAEDIYEGVVSGVADIGHGCISYNPGRFPLMQVTNLPGIEIVNNEAFSHACWEMVIENNHKYKELQDAKFLLVYGTGSGALHAKKPINTLEDLKGLQVRVTPAVVDALESLGATPVAMPMSEAYEAMSKGVVNALLVPVECLEGWNFAEITDYTIITPFITQDFDYFAMNIDVWNSLTPEIQEAIERVSRQIHEEVTAKLWDEIDESGIKFAEAGGQVVTIFPESEKKKAITLLEPLQQRWVEEMESKGLPGAEVLDEFKGLVAKYNEMFK